MSEAESGWLPDWHTDMLSLRLRRLLCLTYQYHRLLLHCHTAHLLLRARSSQTEQTGKQNSKQRRIVFGPLLGGECRDLQESVGMQISEYMNDRFGVHFRVERNLRHTFMILERYLYVTSRFWKDYQNSKTCRPRTRKEKARLSQSVKMPT